MKTQPPKLHVLTLGCSKNTVDSEVLMAHAKANHVLLTDDPNDADVLVINTCGFILDAKQESIDTILEAVSEKEQGLLKKIVVMGCLSERYKADLQKEIPEVDAYFGSQELEKVLREIGGEYKTALIGERELLTPAYHAYFKISEGCDHPCSFCAIPLMRGQHRSKPMEELLVEAKLLRKKGVRELNMIAQDLTYYGMDLYGSRALADLLKRVSDVGFDWIRLHYAFPANFPTDILPVMHERENICKYLDIPIQHINTDILKSMRRGITKRKTVELLEQIRTEVPGIRLRTTLITGYPNETEEIFDELAQFVQTMRFDRLGCFAYSPEENTPAFELEDNVPNEEKHRRVEEIMSIQEQISLEKNEEMVGKTLRVIIDRFESGMAVGRTEFDTPDVDNEFIITGTKGGGEPTDLKIGEFYEATVTDAEPFDLLGVVQK
ncbi:MAG: 30S ribosomal protein S12 methylthiotransferase RimO [Chlorobiales bacterium]|nr:30S ribosomal protein S12 methylthiotransferase RimO [Chlorobiales bacterium]